MEITYKIFTIFMLSRSGQREVSSMEKRDRGPEESQVERQKRVATESQENSRRLLLLSLTSLGVMTELEIHFI